MNCGGSRVPGTPCMNMEEISFLGLSARQSEEKKGQVYTLDN
jgi:hypothetical protein